MAPESEGSKKKKRPILGVQLPLQISTSLSEVGHLACSADRSKCLHDYQNSQSQELIGGIPHPHLTLIHNHQLLLSLGGSGGGIFRLSLLLLEFNSETQRAKVTARSIF